MFYSLSLTLDTLFCTYFSVTVSGHLTGTIVGLENLQNIQKRALNPADTLNQDTDFTGINPVRGGDAGNNDVVRKSLCY